MNPPDGYTIRSKEGSQSRIGACGRTITQPSAGLRDAHTEALCEAGVCESVRLRTSRTARYCWLQSVAAASLRPPDNLPAIAGNWAYTASLRRQVENGPLARTHHRRGTASHIPAAAVTAPADVSSAAGPPDFW